MTVNKANCQHLKR